MPRPAKKPSRPRVRTSPILIRLTEEEHAAFREAAKRAGLGVGPWLRSLGMREAAR